MNNITLLSKLVTALTALLVSLNGGSVTHTNGVYKLDLPNKNFGTITTTPGFNYPTSTYTFNDGDIINAGDFNNILNWIGTKNSTDTTSIAYNAFNPPLSTASGTLSISKGGTATTSFSNTQGLVMASGTSALTSLTTNGNGSIPIASGTTWVANTITAGSNTSIVNTAGNITISSQSKFGGNGASSTLSLSQGTTTLSCNGLTICEFDFSTISLTGTSSLAFSSPSATGTIVILKSQGNVSISASSTISLVDMGGTGGGPGNTTGALGGSGGGGGASSITAGGNGTAYNNTQGASGTGQAFGKWMIETAQTGGTGGFATTTTILGGVPNGWTTAAMRYIKYLISPGSGGGGGGCGSAGSSGGTGGNGAGALYMEVGGALNFLGTINASGSAGTNSTGAAVCGAGGGGGAGNVFILYNSLTANTGTITITGGLGGTTQTAAGNGGNGYSRVDKNIDY